MMELHVFVTQSRKGNGFISKPASRLHWRKTNLDSALSRHWINCFAPHSLQVLSIRV